MGCVQFSLSQPSAILSDFCKTKESRWVSESDCVIFIAEKTVEHELLSWYTIRPCAMQFFFSLFFCYSFRTLITKLQSYLFTFHSNDSAHELEKQKLAWAANEREKWSCTHIHARMCMCIVWSGGKTAVFGLLIRISSLLDCCVAFFMLR